ncbi:GH92 family glycosyl hydrolase [candidate division KSB1 bacterium]|nr:GH92 family glycosyl hydrolase [candidate division KSB1 bacterium]
MKKHSGYYRNLYDRDSGFFRPRFRDGSWLSPFDPVFTNEWPGSPGFVEGSAWHYLFFVNHDVPGLCRLMGDEQALIRKLDECFDRELYVLWNEPDMAYPYLYTYFKGEGWKTQKFVHKYMKKHFSTGPAGIPGNDDTGTISAWYVFSAMGLYPYCPGDNLYRLSSPLFEKVSISLHPEFYHGKKFTIQARNVSDMNIYIQSAWLNGKPYEKLYVRHEDIINGGTLVFDMADRPNKQLGRQ